MEYARREGADWRLEMESWWWKTLSHSAFNPTRASEAFLRKRGYRKMSFRSLKSRNLQEYMRIVSAIVDRDSREIINNSSYVICKWDRSAERGAGTKGEVTLAKYVRKPVYLVTRIHEESIPGWVLGCTTKVFRSFRELKKFLETTFD
jgi:hypothetical protein